MTPSDRNTANTLKPTENGPALAPLSIEPLMADMRNAIVDAEALLKATAQHGGEALDGIRARTRESLRTANLQLARAQQAVMTQTREAARATDAYVHQHPWTAIGVGAGVGVIVGMLLRRR